MTTNSPSIQQLATEMITRQTKDLKRMAMFYTRDEDDAKDLFQDTSILIFRFIKTYEPETNEKAWTRRLMRNCFINQYRKKQRMPQMVDYDKVFGDLYLEGSGSFDDSINFSDSMFTALGALPADNRWLFTMAHVQDFTYEELAAMADLPVGTIRSKLHRAKQLLREHLGASNLTVA